MALTAKQRERQSSPTQETTDRNSTQDLTLIDPIGEGDSYVLPDLLLLGEGLKNGADHDEGGIFQLLYDEIRWQRMFHQQGEVPRLVAVQGEIDEDGSEPVYRHPSDQALPTLRFSPTVQQIRERVQETLKHPVNHVLIQLYRSGADYISEHSDKTLDIMRGSSIANASFGAQRTMRLRLKKSALTVEQLEKYAEDAAGSRQTQRIMMPHNSLFVLGPHTNARWLHGINTDKRPVSTRSDAENAYGGMRISLTFRHIGTFISTGPDEKQRIWGQGATSKGKRLARSTVSNDHIESERLIQAFGQENHDSLDFDWMKTYGNGSDVLHLRDAPEEIPILFLSGNPVQDLRVRLWLEEVSLRCLAVEPPPEVEDSGPRKRRRNVVFRDIDRHKTEVEGALEILAYLGETIDEVGERSRRTSMAAKTGQEKRGLALDASLLYESVDLYALWRHHFCAESFSLAAARDQQHPWYAALRHRNLTLGSNGFVAGSQFGIADCALWPVVREIREAVVKNHGRDMGIEEFDQEFPSLWAWFGRIEGRGSTKRAVAESC